MVDLRLPNITATTSDGKLQQLHGYLQQLVQQLNWALNTVDNAAVQVERKVVTTASSDPVQDFNSIKGLIIKSADIVNAYYETINKKLSGVYVAESDFGTYKEETGSQILANSTGITQLYDFTGKLNNSVSNIEAYIKTGLLYYDENGDPVYGLEIGQNNGDRFDKTARFTANKLAFFDENNTEVAYVSSQMLYINDAQINYTLTMGNLKDEVQSDGSIVTKWSVGNGG